MPDSNSTIEKSLSNSNRPLIGWFHRHQEILWWLHSLYALILGIGMMWLGARKFAYLRIAIFYISFIWLSGAGPAAFAAMSYRSAPSQPGPEI